MKKDSHRDKISDLNATIEKPIILLKNPTIDGKKVGKSFIDILNAKSEQKKVRVPKIKEKLTLSKAELRPRCSFDLPKGKKTSCNGLV